MAKRLSSVDFNNIPVKNLVLESLASAPSSPVLGRTYVNSGTKKFFYHDGTSFIDLRDRTNHTGSQLANTISNFDTQVRTSRLDQMAAPTAAVNFGSQNLNNAGNITANNGAVIYGDQTTTFNESPLAIGVGTPLTSPGLAVDGSGNIYTGGLSVGDTSTQIFPITLRYDGAISSTGGEIQVTNSIGNADVFKVNQTTGGYFRDGLNINNKLTIRGDGNITTVNGAVVYGDEFIMLGENVLAIGVGDPLVSPGLAIDTTGVIYGNNIWLGNTANSSFKLLLTQAGDVYASGKLRVRNADNTGDIFRAEQVGFTYSKNGFNINDLAVIDADGGVLAITVKATDSLTVGSNQLIIDSTGNISTSTGSLSIGAEVNLNSAGVSFVNASINNLKLNDNANANGKKITNLAAPTDNNDAARLIDVQSAAAGIDSKASVRLATTGNINIATGGLLSIDGFTTVGGDRVLVKNQTDTTQNGVYVAAAGAWARAADADATGEITPGAFWYVEQGVVNASTQWRCSAVGTIVLGSTTIPIVQFGAAAVYTASNGVNLTGSNFTAVGDATRGIVTAGSGIQISLAPTTSGLYFNSGNLSLRVNSTGGLETSASGTAIKLALLSGLATDSNGLSIDYTKIPRKFSSTIGDGTATTIAVTHNLGNQDIVLSIRDVATNSGVDCDWVATDVNNVTLTFAVAPALNTIRVVVHG